MTMLAVGGTGQVGSPIVKNLVEHGAEVVVLTQDPGSYRASDRDAWTAVAHIPCLRRGNSGAVALLTQFADTRCWPGMARWEIRSSAQPVLVADLQSAFLGCLGSSRQ